MRLIPFMAVLTSTAPAEIHGVVFNDYEPWFVATDAVNIDLCEWYGGDQIGFHAGDKVVLTTGDGLGRMTDSTDVEADVWVTSLNYVVGVLLTEDPWLVHTKNDKLYRASWVEGQSVGFHVDDRVILSTSSGSGYMLKVGGSGTVAKVEIEQME